WEHWHHKFQAAGVTVGPIAVPEDHFDCPQVAANGLLPEFADEAGLRTIDSPVRVADAPHVPPRHAPRIGQHSESILTELGIGDSAIAQLAASGAVGIGR
ncbi:MAG TPA: CoA transferase, partial [Steroidobacteraceae bacterium]